jgi:hypothetical protein
MILAKYNPVAKFDVFIVFEPLEFNDFSKSNLPSKLNNCNLLAKPLFVFTLNSFVNGIG